MLGGVQDALAPLGGCAVLDSACARCPSAMVDGVFGAICSPALAVHRRRAVCATRVRTTALSCLWLVVALHPQGLGGVPVAEYTPRDPANSVLYAVVREHVETFRVEARRLRDGQGLPRFVDDEFAAFLRCGLPRRRLRPLPVRCLPN